MLPELRFTPASAIHTGVISQHLKGLSPKDREARFLYLATDAEVDGYARGIDHAEQMTLLVLTPTQGCVAFLHAAQVSDRLVATLSVSPGFRRRGIATMMLRLALREAAALGLRQAEFGYLKDNAAAIGLCLVLAGASSQNTTVGTRTLIDLADWQAA